MNFTWQKKTFPKTTGKHYITKVIKQLTEKICKQRADTPNI